MNEYCTVERVERVPFAPANSSAIKFWSSALELRARRGRTQIDQNFIDSMREEETAAVSESIHWTGRTSG